MAEPQRAFVSRLFDNGKGGLDALIPQGVMDAMGWKTGDTLQYAVREDGELIIRKAPPSPAQT